MLLLTGKIVKAHLVPNLFVLPERRNSRYFWNWKRTAKTHACLIRFSGGKYRTVARWNGGTVERWNGGKSPKILKDETAERLNVTLNPKRRNYRSRLRGGLGKELLSTDSRVAFAYFS